MQVEGVQPPQLEGLAWRTRLGLTLAVVALSLLLDPVNLRVRLWLREEVIPGIPPWVDKMTIMGALKIAVWGAIGGLLLGWRGLALTPPRKPATMAWLGAVGSGLALVAIGVGALAIHGPVAVKPHLSWTAIVADVVSNFWEELIFRGAIFGLLLAVLGRARAWLAVVLSALTFSQGHLYYPPAMLLLTFAVGVLWAWMTLRFRSLWPAYVSHTVVDVVAGSLLA